MLSVIYSECRKKNNNNCAECHYAVYRYAEFCGTIAKAMNLPLEWSPLRGFTRVVLSLAHKYQARVEVSDSYMITILGSVFNIRF